jgi:hypothetical protein
MRLTEALLHAAVQEKRLQRKGGDIRSIVALIIRGVLLAYFHFLSLANIHNIRDSTVARLSIL